MSRTPATNQANNPESLLRNDLEDFSRDLLGLYMRFQNMFPVLASSRDSAATATAASASATGAAQSLTPVPGHLRDLAARGLEAIPPSPALTPSQPKADPNLTTSLERKISQEVEAKVKQELTELKDRVNAQHQEVVDTVNNMLKDMQSQCFQTLEAHKKQIEEELYKMTEENLKRQQADEKTREELREVIRKMQGEIEELKKARVQKSVEQTEMPKFPLAYREIAGYDVEDVETNLRGSKEPNSLHENVQDHVSSALVALSSQTEKNTNTPNANGPSQYGTPTSVIGRLDLTTRPANRGQQSVTSLQNTHRESSSADSEPRIPATKRRSHSGHHSLAHPPPDSEDHNNSKSTTSANRSFSSQSALRPGRHPQGTAATATTSRSRSRSPRPSLDANFRVRDQPQPTSNFESRSSHRRSTSSSSIDSIPNDMDSSFQSIPSRFQPSRRIKSANELIDKHLSFIPNGWRTILANTARQLSSEDWDRSDARVLKKLEEHCPSFKGLEEILPNVRMAVPALRGLMRDLGSHP